MERALPRRLILQILPSRCGPRQGTEEVRKSGRLITAELQAVPGYLPGDKSLLWTALWPLPHTTVTQDLVTLSNQEL